MISLTTEEIEGAIKLLQDESDEIVSKFPGGIRPQTVSEDLGRNWSLIQMYRDELSQRKIDSYCYMNYYQVGASGHYYCAFGHQTARGSETSTLIPTWEAFERASQ